MANTTKKNTEVKADPLKSLEVEKQQLESKIAELKELIAQSASLSVPTVDDNKKDVLSVEESIPVVSLVPNKLNLSTLGFGQGVVYTFTGLYDEIEIPWGDLKDIVRSNRKMAQNGKFYIKHSVAVKNLRLQTVYKNLLSPEQLQSLLNRVEDTAEFLEIYKSASEGQKVTIMNYLRDKRLRQEPVNLNVLEYIGKDHNIDLIDLKNVPDLTSDMTQE